MFERALGSLAIRGMRVSEVGVAGVPRLETHFYPNWKMRLQVGFQLLQHLGTGLIRDHAATDFGTGSAWQDSFTSLPLIARRDAVDLDSWASKRTFDAGVAGLSIQLGCA